VYDTGGSDLIGIIDYGLGNISAIYNIYKRLNIPVEFVSKCEKIETAQKLILPGVGAFDWALSRLNRSGLRDVLEDNVLNKRKPILGICVGMQMMALTSEEGRLKGLGWLEGEVKSFEGRSNKNEKLRLPHMGWNDLQPVANSMLYHNLQREARFYFLHSLLNSFSNIAVVNVFG